MKKKHTRCCDTIIIIKAITRTAWAKAPSQKWKLLKSYDLSFWAEMWHDHHAKIWRANLSTQSCICVRKKCPKIPLNFRGHQKRERTWPLRFKKVMIMLLEKTYEQLRVYYLFRYKNRLGGTYGDSGDLSRLTFGRRRRLNLRAFFHPPKDVPNHYSVVSIKRTGCNKQTGWSKNFI